MRPCIVLLILLVSLIGIPATMALESEKIYFIELEYNQGALGLVDINLITGYPTLSVEPGMPYKLELVDASGNVLYTGYFDVPNRLYTPPPLADGQGTSVVELDYVKFTISLPYQDKGLLIKVTKGGKEELEIDVSGYAEYCGDNICQPDEDSNACPQDCLSAQQTAEAPAAEGAQLGEGADIQLEEKAEGNIFLPVSAVLVIVVSFVAWVLFRKDAFVLKSISERHGVHIPHRFMNKLVDHIDSSIKSGFTPQQIANHLKTTGWQEKQINEGIIRHRLLGDYHRMKNIGIPDNNIRKVLAKHYTPQQMNETLSHYTVIIGKDAGDEQKIIHLNEIAREYDVHQADSVKKIRLYITECYGYGYTKEIIRVVLKDKKWSDEMIDEAFRGFS